jgi:putative ABC transport system ATP-binding protein
MKQNSIVTFKNVKKSYYLGESEIEALKNINFYVKKKSFTFIVGKSGSGKSTLLNLIGAIDTPSDGTIIINNVDIGTLNDNELSDFRAKNIGHIFQNFNLIPVLNVYENIEYPLLLINENKQHRKIKVTQMIQDVGLEGLDQHIPSQLSGGQRQRVAIARALVKEPVLVLADEPSANLDSKTSEEILKLMQKMQEKSHTTFIFVTHDKDIMGISDETYELKDGVLEVCHV